MLIKTPRPNQATEQQVTDEKVYRDRRNILKTMGFLGASALLTSPSSQAINWFSRDKDELFVTKPLSYDTSKYGNGETLTPEAKVTTHNNFYEFGTSKSDPAQNAQGFKVDPWTLKVDGLVEKPLTLGYEDLTKTFDSSTRTLSPTSWPYLSFTCLK